MCQLDSDVVIDRISVIVSRWMIDRGIARTGVVQKAEVPAVSEAEHQFVAIEITDQQPVPGTGVNRPVTEGNACSVDIAPAGRVGPDFLNNVDEISNEQRTGADRFLVTLTRSRRVGRRQIAEDDGADRGNNFFNDIDREWRAETEIGACRAGDEGLGRGVELVDERSSDRVAVDLEFHWNLRPRPRLDRELPGQETANLGGHL